MKRSGLGIFLTLCMALTTLAGCSGDNRQGKPYTLPSGRVIRILNVGTMNYTGGAPPSLLFNYQTDLKTGDTASLRKEVDEIWPVLRVDAERGNFTSAIISATEVPSGLILKKSHGYRFVYEKRADGLWHSLDDKTDTKK